MPRTKTPEIKVVVVERGEHVSVDVKKIARLFLKFCDNPDCGIEIDPLIRETGQIKCPLCKWTQQTVSEILDEACEKLPFISL